MKPIAILGAGIAGLTAVRALKRRGLPVIVFEAGKSIGGLASSFRDEDGFSHDVGAHFVSNRLAGLLGAADICQPLKHYGEAVSVQGKSFAYPFGLMRSPRFSLDAIKERFREREVHTAADWYRKKFGAALAEEVAIPLTEAWSGAPAEHLSPSVGQKFGPRILKSLYLSAAGIATRRAVCNGYSHERPENAGVYHVYPKGGVARLLEPTANEVSREIRLGSPVTGILTENERVVAVEIDGKEIEVSAAISTAPVHVLPKLVKGTQRLDALARFRYRAMIFVNLHLNGRGLLPDTMLWVPDRSQPFFRLTETPISVPELAPEGKTTITADIGCQVGDQLWTMPEEALAKLCLEGLTRIYPQARADFIKVGGIVRTPVAYPVYLQEYETMRQEFSRSTGVAGLYSVGRNGEFAHILMEDVYWRTLKRMEDVYCYVTGHVPRVQSSLQNPALTDAVAA